MNTIESVLIHSAFQQKHFFSKFGSTIDLMNQCITEEVLMMREGEDCLRMSRRRWRRKK
jgi:hypothetical protein